MAPPLHHLPPRAGSGTTATGRQPDRGDGSFVNPVLPGDHPDPCVLRDGDEYYLSCASQQFSPGAVIWHSRDLVNWTPVGAALQEPAGSVRAVDLVRHAGRWFLYLAVLQGHRTAILALHADDVRGPWSDPVDLGMRDCRDPCHVVAENGSRHLFVNGVRRVRLSDDGLSTIGALQHVQLPAFVPGTPTRCTSSEPRLFWRDDRLYLLIAAGGAGGSARPHTLSVARSRSVLGPWEGCAFNPLEGGEDSAWTTGGCPGLVPGPAGDWWLLCHGQQAGCRTLGRQGLLQAVDWGQDGWFRRRAGAPGRALRKPKSAPSSPSLPDLSDDFSHDRLGAQWRFFDAGPHELRRACFDEWGLLLAAKGRGLADCSPLTCVPADAHFEAELAFEPQGHAQGGLALFHDARSFVGAGVGDGCLQTYSYGQQHRWMQQPVKGARHRLRLTLNHHRINVEHAAGDGPWTSNPWLHNVSVLHLQRSGNPSGLRLAVFGAGNGNVRLQRFTYRSLGG